MKRQTNYRAQYRVEDKHNVNYSGPKTAFKIFEYDSSRRAYIYAGSSFARGWNASDGACIAEFLQRETCEE